MSILLQNKIEKLVVLCYNNPVFMRGILVILAILFFGVLGTVFFVGRVNKGRNTNVPVGIHLADYVNKDNSSVRWTMQGRLVGEDSYRAVRVTVTPGYRRAEILEGYNDKVSKTVELPNTKAGYTDFLLALDNLRFSQERKVRQPDDRGVCPLGYRYIYELNEGDKQKIRLWSDSCVSSDGTMAGQATTIRQLFKAQITDYTRFVSGVKF